MRNFLLSIIIPTKNRSYYCLYAVKQILSLGLDNVEICVQDNSDSDELRSEIESLGSTCIVYNYHPGVLSFVDNFSEAVEISNGEYLCMIGDDDGVLPSVLEYTVKARKDNIDAIIPALNYVYFWPSEKDVIKDSSEGLLQMSESNYYSRKVNPQKALRRLLSNAIQSYTSYDIPRLYHGIVKKSILVDIKRKTGFYFGGLTPDMFMATELALECKRVIRISDSVTISGICPKSGSADSATGRHTGDLMTAPHFRGHASYIWDERIPPFYSVDTIWADTLFHALELSKRGDLIRLFNMPLFDALCLKKYPEYAYVIKEHMKKYKISVFSLKTSYFWYSLLVFAKKATRKIKREFKKYMHGDSDRFIKRFKVFNIIEASEEVNTFIG